MILASPIGGRDLALRKGFSAANSLTSPLSSWAAAIRTLFGASRKRPDPLCCGLSAQDAALIKALRRASGTWGGFQAARPFTHLPRD